jgi:nitronate monooxygenase
MVPMRELTRGLVKETSIPVIASGGIMDGREIAGVLSLGAVAAQLGTAFLLCPECGAPVPYKQALMAAQADATVITRVFSGRPARGLRNAFIEMAGDLPILPFRQQNDLTRPMRNEAGKQGVADYISLWAGRGVARARQMPAAKLVETLVAEIGGR